MEALTGGGAYGTSPNTGRSRLRDEPPYGPEAEAYGTSLLTGRRRWDEPPYGPEAESLTGRASTEGRRRLRDEPYKYFTGRGGLRDEPPCRTRKRLWDEPPYGRRRIRDEPPYGTSLLARRHSPSPFTGRRVLTGRNYQRAYITGPSRALQV